MRFLDADIFLRALVEPLTDIDKAKFAACTALLERLALGLEEARTAEAIVTEVSYVLRSRAQYHLPPAEIAARLRPILTIRGLRLSKKRTFLRALDLWEAHPSLDFEDVLIIAHMEHFGDTELLSYERDFDQIESVRRIEP